MVGARALALRALSSLARGRVDRVREALDDKRLDPRDLGLAFELAHGVLRRQRLLDFVLASLAHRGLPKDPELCLALQLGAYQLLFMHGMPPRAAVHATVELVRGNRGFANAILRRLAQLIELRAAEPTAATTELALGRDRTLVLPSPLPDEEVDRLAIVHSLPDFVMQRWRAAFDQASLRQIAAAASSVPGVYLRAAGSIDPAALQQALQLEGVAVEPAAHARLLRWTGGGSPFATAPFRAGAFVVQDPTALAAAEAVPCRPGDHVIDLCAAPGTKTTLLAERVQLGGRVSAFDIDARRRRRIVDNVARLRLGETVQVVGDVAALPPGDCVLADVPCSNTGVLARRVEVRQRLRATTFAELSVVQRQLLAQAIRLTRPGGTVVYSTCSIDREENDDVVAAVLAQDDTPRCELVSHELTLPAAGLHDGGFFAVLRRLPTNGP